MKIQEIRRILHQSKRSFLQQAGVRRGRLKEWRRFWRSDKQYQPLAPAHAQPQVLKEEYVRKLPEPFEIIEQRYIYGDEFLAKPRHGFGVGCFHLRAPQTARENRQTLIDIRG